MQKIITRIVISAVIILGASVAGFFGTRAWVDYEDRKAQDVWRISQITQVYTGLVAYYKDHAAYPPSKEDGMILGGLDSACLSVGGFVSLVNYECKKLAYLPYIEAGLGKNSEDVFSYHALAKDGKSVCRTKTPRPNCAIGFFLASGSILPSGIHTLTPKGLK